MILVSYPINSNGKNISNPNFLFKDYDTTEREDSIKVYLILLALFGNTLSHYNMSSRSRNSRFENIDDFIDDINCGEIDFDYCWNVILNLEEDDILDITNDYKRDFVIIKGDTNKPLCFGGGEVIVYGEYEIAMADLDESNGDKLHCLLSTPNKECDNYFVHDFEIGFENVKAVGVFSGSKIDSIWFENVLDYFEPKAEETMKNPQKDMQVTLRIQTDYGFTADFLRELANQIEEQGEELTTYETFRGCADIEWPPILIPASNVQFSL